MENEKDLNRFEQLERSIEKLLSGYNALQREKISLEAQLENKNTEIHSLQQTITELNEDKNATLQRVAGLLSSIEAWEESQSNLEEMKANPVEDEEDTTNGFNTSLENPQMSMMSIIR